MGWYGAARGLILDLGIQARARLGPLQSHQSRPVMLLGQTWSDTLMVHDVEHVMDLNMWEPAYGGEQCLKVRLGCGLWVVG